MTKESATLVLIVIAAYEFIIKLLEWRFSRKKKAGFPFNGFKKITQRILYLLSPLLFFLAWMVLNKIFLGWFLWSYNVFAIFNTSYNPQMLKGILSNSFWVHFKWIITISMNIGFILSLFSNKVRKEILRKEFLLFIFLIFVSTVFFLLRTSSPWYYPLPRYFIFAQPLFFIFGTAIIIQLFKRRISHILLLVLAALFISCWYNSEWVWVDSNLNYCGITRIHKKTAEFLEKNFPSSIIATCWPSNTYLSDVRYGYVKKRIKEIVPFGYKQGTEEFFGPNLNSTELEKFILSKKTLFPEREVIFIIARYMLGDRARLIECLKSQGAQLLITFDGRLERIEIYRL